METITLLCTDGSDVAVEALRSSLPILAPTDRTIVVTVDADNPQVQLKALLSNNRVVQRQVVSKIALSRSRIGFRPMAATNGDMSVRDRVDAYAAPLSMAVLSHRQNKVALFDFDHQSITMS